MKHNCKGEFLRFGGVTLLAIVLEMAVFLLLDRVLLRPLNAQPADFLIFHYPGGEQGGLGSMIAYLASGLMANTLSFVLNRKKTFGATNHLACAVGLYAAFTAAVIFLQTLIGPALQARLSQTLPAQWAAISSKGLMMLGNLLISYPMNKYVIMRVGMAKA